MVLFMSSSSLMALQMALAWSPLPVSSTLSLVTMAVCSDMHCVSLKSAIGRILGKRASTSRAVHGSMPPRAFCIAMCWKRVAGPTARRARCLAFLALEAALCSRSFVSRSSSGSSAVLLSVAKVGRTDCMRRLSERGPLSESVYGARVATRRRITKDGPFFG